MTKIIAFVNQKGGVGKTTSCLNIGAALTRKGKRVLLIDADPQGNLTISAGVNLQNDEPTIYEVLKGTTEINSAIQSNPGSYDIIPADIVLSGAEIELSSVPGRELILKESIGQLKTAYDYILIDCPPTLTLLTLNALAASNEIVIPLVAEVLPFKGLKTINDFIGIVRIELNPAAHLTGVLVTRWESTKLSRQIEEGLREQLGNLIFQTKIRKNIRAAEAPLQSQSIAEYDPKSKAAQDYNAFVDELLAVLK